MAIVYATKNGNWSDTTVWNTGALPTAADDVYPNTFIVNINGTFTVNSINNNATTGVTAGGYFSALNGSNLTCTAVPGIVGGATGNVPVYQFLEVASNATATVTGYIQPLISSTTNGKRSITVNSGGTLYVNGTVNAYTLVNANCHPIWMTLGNVVLNGNIYGSNQGNLGGAAIHMDTTAGNLTVVGFVSAGNILSSYTGCGIANLSNSASVYITGNVYGTGYYFNGSPLNGTSSAGPAAVYGPRITVTGNAYGGSLASNVYVTAIAPAINSSGFSLIGNSYGGGQFAGAYTTNCSAVYGYGTIIGDIYGGYQIGAAGAFVYNGNITHTGTCYASANSVAISGSSGVFILSNPPVENANGQPALGGRYVFADSLTSVQQTYFRNAATPTKSYTYDAAYFSTKTPAEANVRSGTTYGLTNEKTGTLAVPQAANVLYGITYDGGTTGTLDVGAQVWNKLVAGTYDAGSIGNLMKNVSTVPVTAAQISALS